MLIVDYSPRQACLVEYLIPTVQLVLFSRKFQKILSP